MSEADRGTWGTLTDDSAGQVCEAVGADGRPVAPHLVHQVHRDGLEAEAARLQIDVVALLRF